MSVEHAYKRRTSADDHPSETVLVITITGSHDIYRFAHHMLTGQAEFAARGQKIIAGLKRRMGAGRWKYMDRSMGGYQIRGERAPEPATP